MALDSKSQASDHDWFKTIHSGKVWAWGAGCHDCFATALKRICPISAADSDLALQADENDDQGTYYAKRLKRAVKAITKPESGQALLTMMVLTQELRQSFDFGTNRNTSSET